MQLVTVAEAAATLAVHEDTVRRMIARGELPAVKIGRNVRIERGELVALVRRQGGGSVQAVQAEAKPISPGKRDALHAKCSTLDRVLSLPPRSTKRKVLAAAAAEEGRLIVSANDLTDIEASKWLDRLDDEIDELED